MNTSTAFPGPPPCLLVLNLRPGEAVKDYLAPVLKDFEVRETRTLEIGLEVHRDAKPACVLLMTDGLGIHHRDALFCLRGSPVVVHYEGIDLGDLKTILDLGAADVTLSGKVEDWAERVRVAVERHKRTISLPKGVAPILREAVAEEEPASIEGVMRSLKGVSSVLGHVFEAIQEVGLVVRRLEADMEEVKLKVSGPTLKRVGQRQSAGW